ncbi:MAG TPA: TetR/AcrR family transcriptional regulator [Hyphomonas sp.]|nr:TetR/AcrR family transcriptional regulator [Hyphomonas sp.]HRK65950.1 TetR/AcrR family transcriptional regulator [Hyphomonas sp.]
MAKSKTFHHGNLRQALIEAALDLLDTEGTAGATIRAVAAKAGVSHAAPANHFKDRKALLTAVAKTEFEQISEHINSGLASRTKDRARIFLDTIANYAFTHPNRYDLLWRSDLVDHSDADLSPLLDNLYASLCAELAGELVHAGRDIDTVAVALWSMMHGYVALRLSGMFQPAKDRVTGEPRYEALMSLLLPPAMPVPPRKGNRSAGKP